MRSLSLLKDWLLREEPISYGADMAAFVLSETDGWMEVPALPCDVHTALLKAGRIKDPHVGLNSFDCEWVEKRSWWFKKEVELRDEDLTGFGAELFLETLDIHADIFVNGVFVAHHASAMYPFSRDVGALLRAGANTLLVRLTTGTERVTDEDIDPVRGFASCEWRTRRKGRGDERRIMLRKPQYVYGWDMTPRLATCALAGDARLDLPDEVALRDIRFETLSADAASAQVLAEVTVENMDRLFARELRVKLSVKRNGAVAASAEKELLAGPGLSYVRFDLAISSPELWWPNGYGDQPLYDVSVSAVNNFGAMDEKRIRTGIRTVKLDTGSINETERRYAFVVNGRRIYAKGSDFIQSDCLYADAAPALTKRLLASAAAAGFCMLRFWDGMYYQPDFVYDLCDELGILVFQDFCFANAAFPDHIESFLDEVRKEARYQLVRLRSHPCIALWCGNGEISGILDGYLGRNFFREDRTGRYAGGTTIYNKVLPELHHALVASEGYVCTSPLGSFGGKQEIPERGDMHFYPFLDYRPENQQNRISVHSFDKLDCKFITESGVMGPPSAKALAAYCGGREHAAFGDPAFEHHDNTFEHDAVRDGIFRHYTGERSLSLEEYCLYGGLFQGTLLGYALDRMRILPYCGGSLFWCLNDGFGEVGFSVLDRSGEPKPAYYFVRRAYSKNRLVLWRDGDRAILFCGNDAPVPKKVSAACGYVSLDGGYAAPVRFEAEIPAFEKAMKLGELPIGDLDLTGGLVYARADGEDILPVTLHAVDFRELRMRREAALSVAGFRREGDTVTFYVSADGFAHAVHFSAEGCDYSDNYFDLLPGETRRVTVRGAAALSPEELAPRQVFRP